MSPRTTRPELEASSCRDFEEVWEERNPEAIAEIYRADYRGHGFPGVGDLSRREYRRFVEEFLGAFSDVEFTIHRMNSGGQLVYADWSIAATHSGFLFGIPPSGAEVRVGGRGVHRYEEGKVVETWLDFDWLALAAQIARGYVDKLPFVGDDTS